jgi:hypothetical protein
MGSYKADLSLPKRIGFDAGKIFTISIPWAGILFGG